MPAARRTADCETFYERPLRMRAAAAARSADASAQRMPYQFSRRQLTPSRFQMPDAFLSAAFRQFSPLIRQYSRRRAMPPAVPSPTFAGLMPLSPF